MQHATVMLDLKITLRGMCTVEESKTFHSWTYNPGLVRTEWCHLINFTQWPQKGLVSQACYYVDLKSLMYDLLDSVL